jgi:hypothetical protein
VAASPNAPAPTSSALKDALLAEIRGSKGFFYNMVVAQAQRIDVTDDRVTFTFSANQRALRDQCEQTRPWLEATAERLAGRKISVGALQAEPSGANERDGAAPAPAPGAHAIDPNDPKRDLKAEAMSSSAVQAVLDVFPAEIRDVEEM